MPSNWVLYLSLGMSILLNTVAHRQKRAHNCSLPHSPHPPFLPSEGQKSFFPILCTQLHLLISPESVCVDKSGQLVCRVPVQDSCSIVYSLPAAAPLQQYPQPLEPIEAKTCFPSSLSLPRSNLWHARDFSAKTFFFLIQINKSKVLPPPLSPTHCQKKEAGEYRHGKEVSGPAGGRVGEKETSAHYFA